MKPESLLGQAKTSPDVQMFTSTLSGPADVTAASDSDTEYLAYPKSGISFALDAKSLKISTIFLHNNTEEGVYGGALPHGVAFSMSRPEARVAVRRSPDGSNDKYRYDTWEEYTHKLRVEYASNFNSIVLVVLMTT